jgi:hypothetical protein
MLFRRIHDDRTHYVEPASFEMTIGEELETALSRPKIQQPRHARHRAKPNSSQNRDGIAWAKISHNSDFLMNG